MKNRFEARIEENLSQVDKWEIKSLGKRFKDFVGHHNDKTYIVTKENQYSYSETQKNADSVAKGLMKMGFKRHDNIGQIMGNYAEAVFATLGVAIAGCVNVPFNYRMGKEDLSYVLKQSDTACLITMDEWGKINYIEILKQLCPEVFEGEISPNFPFLKNIIIFSPQGKKYKGTMDFHDLIASGSDIPDTELESIMQTDALADDVAVIMYTSGTTGNPKGVMLTHDMLWRKSYCSLLGRAFEKERRILIPLPIYHIFGLVEGILAAPWVGGSIILQSQWYPQETLLLIESFKANDILTVPTMGLDLINQENLNKYDLSSLTSMYCAGAPGPISLWRRLIEELGLEYLNTGYGMTETSSAPVQSPYYASVEQIATRCGVVIPGGAAGSPEFGGKCIQYKTIDQFTGNDMGPGEPGELVCKGNVVTKGYYKKQKETEAAFDKNGWFRSGDLCIIHDDGFIEIIGRSKEIFRVGGENVAPKEVEEFISTHPKVNQVYVVGVPHERLNEIGMAFVELVNGEECDEKEIIAYCQENLARFKVPKYIKFLKNDEFPKTVTGKIQKFKLQEIGKENLGI